MVVGPVPDPSTEPPVIGPNDPDEPDEEGEEDDEDDFCLIPSSSKEPDSKPTATKKPDSTTTKAAEPTTKKPDPPPVPPKDKPDFSKDSKPKYYGSGEKARRASMIEAITYPCKPVAGETYTKPYLTPTDFPLMESGKSYMVYNTTFEVRSGLEWTIREYDCGQEFRKIVDGCDT
jgi:hypothetical protein